MGISHKEFPPADPRLNWRSTHDSRSRQYSVGRKLNAFFPRGKRLWEPGPVLDQGREGACVGYGWAAELGASPVRVPNVNNAYATGLYHRARQLDQWEGESYEGTSVLGGARAAKELGLVTAYHWAFGVDDIIDAVVQLGPVVIGIPWYDSMYETRPSGLVETGGSLVGGHCLTIVGYHPNMRLRGEGWFRRHEVFKWQNSWSEEYGVGGFGYITPDELEPLLDEYAESCVPDIRLRSRVA